MATIQIKKTKFVDIDLSFSKHPVSGDLTRKIDVNAIAASLKTLVMTKKYERPFHPELSCQVSDLLFENFTPDTGVVIKKTIEYVIANFEPRVQLVKVSVNPDPDSNNLTVDIMFKVIGFVDVYQTHFYLERTI